MSRSNDEVYAAARAYLTAVYGEEGADDIELLGFGEDGFVWRSIGMTAVKAFYRSRNYTVELDCYTRLSTWNGVTDLAGFAVPALLGHDDRLMVIEMGLVAPPCVLDFGKAYLDRPGDYPEGVLEDSLDSFRENYSERDWERVEELVSDLQTFGIYYYDLKPGNIQFPNGDYTLP